jgi:hypothetical protein
MHQNIKNAQYILENKMLTSIVTHYKSLELIVSWQNHVVSNKLGENNLSVV